MRRWKLILGLLRVDNLRAHGIHITVGLIAQLVEHCTSIAKVMGSNPVQTGIFFRLSIRNCLSCVVTARIFLLFDLSSAVQNICFIYLCRINFSDQFLFFNSDS